MRLEAIPTRLLMHFAYLQYIQIREVPGVENNPQIMEWFKILGKEWVQGDETAWCAAMHNAIAKTLGLEHTLELTARSILDVGENIPLKDAKLGHTAIFWREDPASWKGHVGIIARVDTGRQLVWLHGGNQNNMVNCSAYPIEGGDYGLLAVKELRYL